MNALFRLPVPTEEERPVYQLRQEINELLKRARIRRESIEILVYDEHAGDSLPIFELLLIDLANVVLSSLRLEKVKTLSEAKSKCSHLEAHQLRMLKTSIEKLCDSQSNFISDFQSSISQEGLLDRLFKEINSFFAQQKAGSLSLQLDKITAKRNRLIRNLALLVLVSISLLFLGNFILQRLDLNRQRAQYLASSQGIRLVDLRNLVKALERYHHDNKRFPVTGNQWYGFKNCWGLSTPDWIPGLAPKYIAKLPRDPRLNEVCDQQYIYRSDNGDEFRLLAHSPNDCKKVQQLFPEMIDIAGCHRYGYWTVNAKVINLKNE